MRVALSVRDRAEALELAHQRRQRFLGVRADFHADVALLRFALAYPHLLDVEVRARVLDRAPHARQDQRIDDMPFQLDYRACHDVYLLCTRVATTFEQCSTRRARSRNSE